MFSAKQRKLEREIQALRTQLESTPETGSQAKTDTIDILTVVTTGAVGLLTAAAVVYGPALLRQENLGVATEWNFFQYAGISADNMPKIGQDFDYRDINNQNVRAFRGGSLLISLTAEKDRNYTVTDVDVELSETAPPKALWYYIPPPAAGSGPSMNNVELSLDLDTQSWTNLDPATNLPPEVKFSPFNLTSESPATIRISVTGTTDQAFSISMSYQTGGGNEVIEETTEEFIIYGDDKSASGFTSEQSKVVAITK